jgi:hypothetical protein
MLKAVSRTVIDFCVVPGTAIGAEILWIYTLQWKNRFSLLALALISFTYSNMHMTIEDRQAGKVVNEPESTR